MPRHDRRRGRLAAAIAFIYVWAFVALGLTHRHPAQDGSRLPALGGVAAAVSRGPAFVPASASPAEESCPLCAMAHTTVVALAQPALGTQAPALYRALLPAPASSAPTRSFSASNP